MRILLTTLGTRGDAEPFLTLGYHLRAAGHELRIVLPEQLTDLAEDAGLDNRPLTPAFLNLIEGGAGREVMGGKGNGFQRGARLLKLYHESRAVQRTVVREQAEAIADFRPDRIVTHPKCLFVRVHGYLNPGKVFVASPVPNAQHPTGRYPHIGIPRPLGPALNRASYALTNRITAGMATRFGEELPPATPERNVSAGALRRYFLRTEPWLYLVSPTLYPRPDEWPAHAHLLGYHERPKAVNWEPPPALLRFLNRYAERGVTLITFGSMVNNDPAGVSRYLIETLRRERIPALMVTSSGGLEVSADLPEHVHAVGRLPYDWAFPRIGSVVHHGGAGTTHTALRHGRPCMVIPHIIDQFFWSRRVAELGAGPLGPSIKRLKKHDLAAKLRDLRTNPAYAVAAGRIGRAMQKEAEMMDRAVRLVVGE